ncbi:hypothetical protein O9187_02895, partial [Treponema pallidum]
MAFSLSAASMVQTVFL